MPGWCIERGSVSSMRLTKVGRGVLCRCGFCCRVLRAVLCVLAHRLLCLSLLGLLRLALVLLLALLPECCTRGKQSNLTGCRMLGLRWCSAAVSHCRVMRVVAEDNHGMMLLNPGEEHASPGKWHAYRKGGQLS